LGPFYTYEKVDGPTRDRGVHRSQPKNPTMNSYYSHCPWSFHRGGLRVGGGRPSPLVVGHRVGDLGPFRVPSPPRG